MIGALNLKIAAIRQKRSGIHIELRGGELVGQTEGLWFYRFSTAKDLNIRDETPVRGTAGQEDVRGVLVSFRDGVLVVALDKNVGPRIAVARLIADDAFLIERLQDRLEEFRSGKARFNRAAAERILGLAPPRTALLEPHPDAIQGRLPNADQLRAIRLSLGSDTAFIWGPPGTGKTETLARIVEAHYHAGSIRPSSLKH